MRGLCGYQSGRVLGGSGCLVVLPWLSVWGMKFSLWPSGENGGWLFLLVLWFTVNLPWVLCEPSENIGFSESRGEMIGV